MMLRSYMIKLDTNKKQNKILANYFYEAKVLYNYVVSLPNAFLFDRKCRNIEKISENGENTPFTLTIPYAIRCEVVREIWNNIRRLHGKKMTGVKIGSLKHKRKIRSIPVYQPVGYVLTGKYVKIVGLTKQAIRCFGTKQLHGKLHGAKLVQRPSGYYLFISCEDSNTVHKETKKDVGIDFGIKTDITLSTGEKFIFRTEYSNSRRRLQRKLAKSVGSHSNRRGKLWDRLCRKYESAVNKKLDFVNKIVHMLDTKYDHIVWQDENIRGWMHSHMDGFFKRIYTGCQGKIKDMLNRKRIEEPDRFIQLGKYVPTTSVCTLCGHRQSNILKNRVYVCPCGYSEDRDVHAAKNMLIFAGLVQTKFKLPSDGGEVTPREKRSSTVARKSTATCTSVN